MFYYQKYGKQQYMYSKLQSKYFTEPNIGWIKDKLENVHVRNIRKIYLVWLIHDFFICAVALLNCYNY